MAEKILIAGDRKEDLDLFKEILGSKEFEVEGVSQLNQIERLISTDRFDAVFSDFDLAGDMASKWLRLIQENKSQTCFIVYGDTSSADKISKMLQIGAYDFIPRALLSERIYGTLVDGLENRKAFMNILGMIGELKSMNEKLEVEKVSLKKKNHELAFINQLSSEVAYDLDWDEIMSRIIDAGLMKVIEPEFISILYRIGTKWHLSCYLPESVANSTMLESIRAELVDRFFALSGERISTNEIATHVLTSRLKTFNSVPFSSPNLWVQSLCPTGRPLGLLVITPGQDEFQINSKREFVSTIVNILGMSLNNAQEYHQLKELTLMDGLTGVLNQKGFREFIEREFQKAKRYNKHFSLVMIDLDNFKQINDYYGHLAGDFILQEFSRCMKKSLRKTDIVARYGGDEFAIILPETLEDHTQRLVRRLCVTLDNHTYKWKAHEIKLTFSYGLACDKEFTRLDSVDELISAADYRLYQTKQAHTLDEFGDAGQILHSNMAVKQA